MGTSKLAGAWGEAIAAEYLRKKHYQIVANGYHSRFGEIDLIARNRKFLIFVEVKLRKNARFAQAQEYVDTRKQDRLRTTALLKSMRRRELQQFLRRFTIWRTRFNELSCL